jgi:hypothetical protein
MEIYVDRPPSSREQRGVSVLLFTVLLLAVVSIGVLFANRTVLFEQKTGANQLRATQALQVAEAGIEWATGMLNSPAQIGTDCVAAATALQSFRRQYVQTKVNAATSPSSDFFPATNVFPGCKLTAAGLNCNCPAVPAAGTTAVANLGSNPEPSFTVAFENVPGDSLSLKVTAYGCAAQAASCTSTNFAASDSNARVSVLLKLRPLLRAAAPAPLTCGTSCTIGGSFNLINLDVASNGILAVAGTVIDTKAKIGGTTTTLPGQPELNALIGSDSSLAAISSGDPTCSNSSLFNAFFGTTIPEYRSASSTRTLACAGAADCASKLSTAYSEGWRSFFFTTDLQLSGSGTYGSRNEPISIVTASDVKVNGSVEVYGVIFSNNANWSNTGSGSSIVHGAEIACAAYETNGNGTVAYDPIVLQNVRNLNGNVVRVPGSWRDFRIDADVLP